LERNAAWPKPTDRLATLALALDLAIPTASGVEGLLRRQLGLGSRSVLLEIVDYPGEWLLDLALLQQGFGEWSAAELARSAEPPRDEAARPWRARLGQLDPRAPARYEELRELQHLYASYLQTCRQRFGLANLSPGRFLSPDNWAGMPFLLFCPLPRGPYPSGSLGAAMVANFDEYARRTRSEFVEPHLARFDAQIVLVDLFRALASGAASFRDTQTALASIGQALAPRSGLLDAVGLGETLPRTVFAATKADYLPDSQRGQLRRLLSSLVGESRETIVLAAIRCTTETTATDRGRPVPAVEGLVQGGGREAFWFAGGVPVDPPTDAWFDHRYEVPTWAPPALEPRNGVPHIGLDTALTALLPDLLG